MIVYRPDGVAENKDTCDARECVNYCGYTTEPKDVAKQAEVPKVVQAEDRKAVADEVTIAHVSQVSEEYVPKHGRPSKLTSIDTI